MPAEAMTMQERLKQASKKKAPQEITKEVVLPELEVQVLAFIKQVKYAGNSDIPLYGATNPEIAMAFPNVNSNTLRYAVYHLRKKGKVRDEGLTRHIEKGKVGCVIWMASEV